MGKNKDLIVILLFVLIGMFIPFLGSITLNYGFSVSRIAITFAHFLIIFGIELSVVYLYFFIGNKIAIKKIEKIKQKNQN